MSYKVIKFFTDLQDGNHPYNEGDTYPREGVEATEVRIAELLGSANQQSAPLIMEVAEEAEGGTKGIDDMTVKELIAYAQERGIELGEASKKADILDVLKNAEDTSEE